MLSKERNDGGPYNFNDPTWPGLSKLIEECGEVITIAAKLIATNGGAEHWAEESLYTRLEEEMGDALAAIDFVITHNAHRVSRERVNEREAKKWMWYRQWHAGESHL